MVSSRNALLVERLEKVTQSYQYYVLVRVPGVSTGEMEKFRVALHGLNFGVSVVKNNILRMILRKKGYDASYIDEVSKGSLALVYANDIIAICRLVRAHLKNMAGHYGNKDIRILCGFYGQEILSAEAVEEFACLPSFEVLRANMVSALAHPLCMLASALQMNFFCLARILECRLEELRQNSSVV